MTLSDCTELKIRILSEAKKKTGNHQIHLESTPHGKARVIIGDNRSVKDFVNETDALMWLIYSYNLKHLIPLFTNRNLPVNVPAKTSKRKKRDTIDEAAHKIFTKISHLEYYDIDLYHDIMNDFNTAKINNAFSEEEAGYVFGIVMDGLNKLLDETMDHRNYQTYKRYLAQFKASNLGKKIMF